MKQSYKTIGRMILILLILLIVGIAALFLTKWILTLRDPAQLAAFQDFISSLGIGGWLLLLLIQYIQIVIAFIPGGPIQIVSGLLFGPWGGIALFILGTLLSTATVFTLVKRYGDRVVRLFIKDKEWRKYRFLQDEKRLETLIVILFLIPGTPKDILTYLLALTTISCGRFMLLSTAARLPAAFTSVLAGSSIASGSWLHVVILFIVLSVISLGGLIVHRKLMAFYQKQQSREKDRRH